MHDRVTDEMRGLHATPTPLISSVLCSEGGVGGLYRSNNIGDYNRIKKIQI